MVVPCGNLKVFPPRAWLFLGQFKSFLLMGHEKLLRANHVLIGARALVAQGYVPQKTNTCKISCNLIFPYEFRLNCFQLQSCRFSGDLSNNRSQNLYKNEHEMVIVAKRFGTYLSLENLGLFEEEVHCSSGKFPFLFKEFIFFLVKVVFWGTLFAP